MEVSGPEVNDKSGGNGIPIMSDRSEDLYSVHDFDIKIDLEVPSAGKTWNCLFQIKEVLGSSPGHQLNHTKCITTCGYCGWSIGFPTPICS
jgi:hypothetical protein